MTSDPSPEIIDQLDALLEQERAALLEGDLEAIADLLEQKENLIDAMNAVEDAMMPDLRALHDKVSRNQALLDGALMGIRKVAARMAALRRIRRSLETYDETGRRRTIKGEVIHRVEKRA